MPKNTTSTAATDKPSTPSAQPANATPKVYAAQIPGAAPPRQNSVFAQPPLVLSSTSNVRPGANDHQKFLSKGNLT